MAAPTDNQLSAAVVRVAVLGFLDILDNPARFALAPFGPIIPPAISLLDEPDVDFDGQTFHTLDPRMLGVAPISQGADGQGELKFTLSGTLELDSQSLNDFTNRSHFWERRAALWPVLFDEQQQLIAAGNLAEAVMTNVKISATPPDDDGHAMQTIEVTAKGAGALLANGGGKTILWTPDPDDQAAGAILGTAGSVPALGQVITLPGGQTIDLSGMNLHF